MRKKRVEYGGNRMLSDEGQQMKEVMDEKRK